jgi:hypothetical protein
LAQRIRIPRCSQRADDAFELASRECKVPIGKSQPHFGRHPQQFEDALQRFERSL